jgi:dUTPase
MRLSKIKNIEKVENVKLYDITVGDNHNFFCNGFLIHNSGFRGPIICPFYNYGREQMQFSRGDRIAQMVVRPVMDVVLEEGIVNKETDRKDGGYGSTGR